MNTPPGCLRGGYRERLTPWVSAVHCFFFLKNRSPNSLWGLESGWTAGLLCYNWPSSLSAVLRSFLLSFRITLFTKKNDSFRITLFTRKNDTTTENLQNLILQASYSLEIFWAIAAYTFLWCVCVCVCVYFATQPVDRIMLFSPCFVYWEVLTWCFVITRRDTKTNAHRASKQTTQHNTTQHISSVWTTILGIACHLTRKCVVA